MANPLGRPAPPGAIIGGVVVGGRQPPKYQSAFDTCIHFGSTLASLASEGAKRVPTLIEWLCFIYGEVRAAFREVPASSEKKK